MAISITPGSSYQGIISEKLRETVKIFSQGVGQHDLFYIDSFIEYQVLNVLERVVEVTQRVYPADDGGLPLFGNYAALGYAHARAFDHVAYILQVIPTQCK